MHLDYMFWLFLGSIYTRTLLRKTFEIIYSVHRIAVFTLISFSMLEMD